MYKHLLIPTDGSKLSDKAIKEGVQLAKSIGAQVTGFTATQSFHTFTADPLMATDTEGDYKKDSRKLSEKALGAVKRACEDAGVKCDTNHAVDDQPFHAIIRAAKSHGCDLIFMASHGRRGVAGLLLGGETTKVLTHSKIPVLVCR